MRSTWPLARVIRPSEFVTQDRVRRVFEQLLEEELGVRGGFRYCATHRSTLEPGEVGLLRKASRALAFGCKQWRAATAFRIASCLSTIPYALHTSKFAMLTMTMGDPDHSPPMVERAEYALEVLMRRRVQ